jgi:hypothetical protein
VSAWRKSTIVGKPGEDRTVMPNKRGARRVAVDRAIPANIMAIDGTWRRTCTVKDVSDTGAKLMVDASDQGLALKEFFLVLRRPAWLAGDVG